ncbi:hypothetical protein ACFLT2_06830, partial [Acidobacteriota bacterium]
SIVYLILAIVILLAALWIFLIPFLKRFFSWWKRRNQLQAKSEKAYFKKFQLACRKGNPRSIMQSLMSWLDRAHKGPEAVTLEHFLKEADNLELTKQTEQLMMQLYGQGQSDDSQKKWSGSRFFKSFARARRKLLKAKKIEIKPDELQPLNP